jgi:hypothetical protein
MSTDDPNIYCNPLDVAEECAIGLRKWAKEYKKGKHKKKNG